VINGQEKSREKMQHIQAVSTMMKKGFYGYAFHILAIPITSPLE
jgi:hypothetical protein